MDLAEQIARKYIEGVGGLFDMYHYELAAPVAKPPEVEGARWILICLAKPENREDLDRLITYSDAEKRIRQAKENATSTTKTEGT